MRFKALIIHEAVGQCSEKEVKKRPPRETMNHKLNSCRPQWSAEGVGKLAREKMLLYDALRKYMWKISARFKDDVMGCSVLIASREDNVHSEQNTDEGSVKSTTDWQWIYAIFCRWQRPRYIERGNHGKHCS